MVPTIFCFRWTYIWYPSTNSTVHVTTNLIQIRNNYDTSIGGHGCVTENSNYWICHSTDIAPPHTWACKIVGPIKTPRSDRFA